jgi:hypothetical protein
LRQLTTLTSVQGSRHDISKFKQNKKLLHSLKGGYEINLQSKLVTRKLITKKKEREKDSLPSHTSRAGVSVPHEREGAWGIVLSSAHCSSAHCHPCVSHPLLLMPLSSCCHLFLSPSCHDPSPLFHHPHSPPCEQGLAAVGGVCGGSPLSLSIVLIST